MTQLLAPASASVPPSRPLPSVPIWQKVGRSIDRAGDSIAALRRASLDWSVKELPIELSRPFHENRIIRTHKAIVRADNEEVLGVVGARYQPIQNTDAFRFLDSIVGERLASFETAGELHGGKVVWLLLRIPSELRVRGTDDVVEPYLLCINSHDGTRAFRVFNTAVRVICQNSLTMALRTAGGAGLALRHTESALCRIEEARRTLGIATRQYAQLNTEMNRLAATRITEIRAKAYFQLVWPDNPEVEDSTRTRSVRERMLENFQREGEQMPKLAGTAWLAYNAVSHYTDWERPTRGLDDARRANHKFESILLGDSASLKRQAWADALTMASSN